VSKLLEIRELSAGYGQMQILHEVEMTVDTNERVGLLGLNGHGKTTLLRAIAGLADWREGSIELRGKSIMRLQTHDLVRAGVVLIPQGDALFPGLTVRENLDSGAYLPRSWRQRKKLRERVLELFPQLADRLGQVAATLSGGERRMVAIGRGLMTQGSFYLIDEPSLGLAPGAAKRILDALLSLDLEQGGMLLAEQNSALLEGRIDRTLWLHGGRVSAVESGSRPGLAHGRVTPTTP
jgi:branched-chain amino acid transport system ATP-binding protein